MTDERLMRFMRSVGRTTMVSPYETQDDESIAHFVWLLDVPEADLCAAQDDAILLSLNIYDPDPVPFVIGVADPDKSRFLRSQSQALVPSSSAAAAASTSDLLNQPSTSSAQLRPRSPSAFVLGSRSNASRTSNIISGPNTPSNSGSAYAH